jgi:type I restriction enzyme S subunit
MSRYKAYAEYKDSGIEWLGLVPMHWTVSKIKYLTSFQVGWTPPTKDDANFEGENLWANISDLRGREIFDTNKKISDDAAKKASMDITPRGSLMYSFKLSVGAVSFAGKDMYTNEAIASFLEKSELPLAYLYYVLPKFVIENASTNIYGARILNQELISNADLLAPSFEEAKTIANFLDHETAKIDTLIAKQQGLIKLLKEKRQAVISHAVTKGINPNAPMRDSGVEWLGEVPAHWELPKLNQRTSRIGDGLHASPQYQDGTGIYFINGNNLVDGKILIGSTAKEVPESEYENHFVFLDDSSVLLSINGTIGNVAKFAGERVVLGKSAAYINCLNNLVPDYLMFYLQSSNLRHYFDLEVTGTTIFNLSLNSIRRLRVCCPSKNEQREIVEFCVRENAQYDKLIEQVDRAIRLSQERRTALISAAVTGKIDVRDWQPASVPELEDAAA